MSFLNTFKTKIMGMGKRSSDTCEAITFSSTDPENGEVTTQRMACCENQGKNLVVATLESRFTGDMIDYALEMAQRMDFGIIAINAANLTHDVTEFFSTSHEEIFQDFKETATRNVTPFRQKAEALGLKFAHAIKYSDVDTAIADVTMECGQIEFIITENREPVTTRDQVVNENRIAQRLFVYSVAE